MQMENDDPHDGQKGKLTKVIMPQVLYTVYQAHF